MNHRRALGYPKKDVSGGAISTDREADDVQSVARQPRKRPAQLLLTETDNRKLAVSPDLSYDHACTV